MQARFLIPAVLLALLLGSVSCIGFGAPGPAGTAIEDGDRALRDGDAETAVAAYRRALDLAPRNPVALHGLARAYAARGDVEAALGIYSGLELGAPNYFAKARADCAAALDVAADDRKRQGDLESELRLLERLSEVTPDPTLFDLEARLRRARLECGEQRLASGRPQPAERLFRAVLKDDPQALEALLGLAMALEAQNRGAEAAALLDSAAISHPDSDAIRRAKDRLVRNPSADLPANASP